MPGRTAPPQPKIVPHQCTSDSGRTDKVLESPAGAAGQKEAGVPLPISRNVNIQDNAINTPALPTIIPTL